MSAITDLRIGIIGGGAMGGALARAALSSLGLPGSDVLVFEPDPARRQGLQDIGVTAVLDQAGAQLTGCNLVVFAVKPQSAEAAIPSYARFLSEQAAILSVLAGTPIDTVTKLVGKHANVVRCMPNLPALAGRGMSVFFAPDSVDAGAVERCTALLRASGTVLRVSSEEMIDASTAISGSGPGYFYFFCDLLVRSATDLGFTPEQALLLVQSTFSGSAALWEAEGGHPSALVQRVASKGGTTEAALNVFNEGALPDLFSKAIGTAYERARILSKR